jgi:hypothetical protein
MDLDDKKTWKLIAYKLNTISQQYITQFLNNGPITINGIKEQLMY